MKINIKRRQDFHEVRVGEQQHTKDEEESSTTKRRIRPSSTTQKEREGKAPQPNRRREVAPQLYFT